MALTDHEVLLAIQHSVQLLHSKVDILMTQQDDVNAVVTEIESDVADLTAASDAIKAEIANLEAQIAANQPVDLTALKAAVGNLDLAKASIQSNVPPATP